MHERDMVVLGDTEQPLSWNRCARASLKRASSGRALGRDTIRPYERVASSQVPTDVFSVFFFL